MTDDDAKFAVIFSFHLRSVENTEYHETMARLGAMAHRHPGFISEASVVSPNGAGLSVSYWRSLGSIKEWSARPDHSAAKMRGQAHWYECYDLQIAEIVRVSTFDRFAK